MKITNRLVEEFRAYLVREEKSESTREKYLRDIKAFFLWSGNKELNKDLVLAYKQHIMKLYATASVNSMLSSLNSFFAYNEWHELRVKTLKIQRQLFVNRDRELTKAEYKRLLQAAKSKGNERLYLLMQTICASGIRVSELSAVTVEAVARRQAVIRCKGKTRVAFLPDDLCRMLMKFIRSQGITKGPVFVTRTGRPLDRSNIWHMMKQLCQVAGVQESKVFPHNLRHLFARTYYSLQKDIVRLADILGHQSVNTTRIYTAEAV